MMMILIIIEMWEREPRRLVPVFSESEDAANEIVHIDVVWIIYTDLFLFLITTLLQIRHGWLTFYLRLQSLKCVPKNMFEDTKRFFFFYRVGLRQPMKRFYCMVVWRWRWRRRRIIIFCLTEPLTINYVCVYIYKILETYWCRRSQSRRGMHYSYFNSWSWCSRSREEDATSDVFFDGFVDETCLLFFCTVSSVRNTKKSRPFHALWQNFGVALVN